VLGPASGVIELFRGGNWPEEKPGEHHAVFLEPLHAFVLSTVMQEARKKEALEAELKRYESLEDVFPDGPIGQMIREVEDELRQEIAALENSRSPSS
jgi:hypothetical protein